MTEEPPLTRNPQEVSPEIESLLCRLVFDAVPLPAPRFGRVAGGQWGGGTLDGIEAECLQSDGAFKLEVVDDRRDRFPAESYNVHNQPGELSFDDGSVLSAPFVHLVSSRSSFSPQRYSRICTLDFSYWRWKTGRRGVAWLGALKHARVENGNLTVVEGDHDRFNRCGLRLRGCYTWTLIQREDGVIALIEVDGKLERGKLWADFNALEFAMGTPLELDLLVEVDEADAAVGAYAPELGIRCTRGNTHEPPVATGRWAEDRLNWTVPLFGRIAQSLDTEEAKLLVGITGYVDALVDHLEASYVKAQIALEAVAREVSEEQSVPHLVTTPADWTRWVVANESVIRSFARDAPSADRLVNKVRNAFQGSATDAVPGALAALGVTLPANILLETRGRNVAAHRYRMPGEPGADPDGDLRRLRIIRTVLAIVVAGAAGYRGPMLGWEIDDRGHRVPISPFSEDDDQRALADQWFQASRSSPSVELEP